MQIRIYRKPTYSGRYLHFKSAHQAALKRNVMRGLWLHAVHLLASFPIQLQQELHFLKETLCSTNNGYPITVVNKWFAAFCSELSRNPDILNLHTRLIYDDLFFLNGQQIFVFPNAESRFEELDNSSDCLNNANSGDQMQVNETVQITSVQALDATTPVMLNAAMDHALQCKRYTVCPFVPGVSDKLWTIATRYGLSTWHTYPGKIREMFSLHRGWTHTSKTKNSIYCTTCSCRVQYVGESNRNLKLRLSEHLNQSSQNSLSKHLRRNCSHSPCFWNTVVIARESGNLKRKITESLAIEHKAAKLANTGPSVDLPTVWHLCAQGLDHQLTETD